jgi:hypothetical protein
MELINTTGVATSTAKAVLNTGVGGFVLTFSEDFASFNDETINIVKDTPGGKIAITPNGAVSLKRWLLALNYGDTAICGDATHKTVVAFDLVRGGAIPLGPKEQLIIEMKNLEQAYSYILDGLDQFNDSPRVITLEDLSISADEKAKKFNTLDYDMMVIDDLGDITEVNFTADNGNTVKHSLRELRAISKQLDPIQYVKQAGTVASSFAGFIQFPLAGIAQIEFIKEPGNVFNVLFRRGV